MEILNFVNKYWKPLGGLLFLVVYAVYGHTMLEASETNDMEHSERIKLSEAQIQLINEALIRREGKDALEAEQFKQLQEEIKKISEQGKANLEQNQVILNIILEKLE